MNEKPEIITIDEEKQYVFLYCQHMRDGVPCEESDQKSRPNENESSVAFLFCPHCNNASKLSEYYIDSEHLKCPHCGKKLSVSPKWRKLPKDEVDFESNIRRLLIDGKETYELKSEFKNAFKHALKYWLNKDRLIVRDERVSYRVLNKKGKYSIEKKSFKNYMKFNFVTGHSYASLYTDDEWHLVKRYDDECYDADIGNISYPYEKLSRVANISCCEWVTPQVDLYNDALNNLLKDIGEKIFEKEKFETISGWGNFNVYSFAQLNYFSCLSVSTINSLCPFLIDEYGCTLHRIEKSIPLLRNLQKTKNANLLPKYMRENSVVSRIAKDSTNYFIYKGLYYLGIRDTDTISCYIDELSNSDFNRQSAIDFLINIYQTKDTHIPKFVKWFINGKDKKEICDSLISIAQNWRILRNSAETMEKILENGGVLPNNNGNIKEVCNLLNNEYLRLRNRIFK